MVGHVEWPAVTCIVIPYMISLLIITYQSGILIFQDDY